MKHRQYLIVPKRDWFPARNHGFVVVDLTGMVNVMPGATWFETVKEAKTAIDVWEAVRHSAEKFWERMQPFKYHVGQKLPDHKLPGGPGGDATITQGRWTAYAKNGVVVKVTKVPWSKYLKKHEA